MEVKKKVCDVCLSIGTRMPNEAFGTCPLCSKDICDAHRGSSITIDIPSYRVMHWFCFDCHRQGALSSVEIRRVLDEKITQAIEELLDEARHNWAKNALAR